MTEHARLGASNAARWINCPGSINLCDGLPRKDSEYAREGRAAHALAEFCLKNVQKAATCIGDIFDPSTGCRLLDRACYARARQSGVEVTGEMADAVQTYLSYFMQLSGKTRDSNFDLVCPKIETQFSLEKLNPPEPMFGTCDASFYLDGELTVVDYKHGAGVAVEIEGNAQLRYYALGAMLTLDLPVTNIKMVIVQPRARHADGPIRSSTLSAYDLLEWGADLMDAARATQAVDAPLKTGEWCRFCDAAPMCPALHEQTQELAQTEFKDSPLPLVERLSLMQMAEVLTKADQIEHWFKNIRGHLTDVLESGGDVPGWKLVPKRAIRKWASKDKLFGWAAEKGVSAQLHNSPELRSPAQLAQALGKDAMPDELVIKVSSGNKLAPDADPRPAQIILSASDEFTVIP